MNPISFTPDGIFDRRFRFGDQLDLGVLKFASGEVWVGGDVIQVQFQGISACILDLLGVIGPAALRHPVQTSDDRNVQSLLSPVPPD